MDTGPDHFWMGHDDDEIRDIYSKLKEDVEEAEIRPGGSVWVASFRLKSPLLEACPPQAGSLRMKDLNTPGLSVPFE
jgi:hypothetical protein